MCSRFASKKAQIKSSNRLSLEMESERCGFAILKSAGVDIIKQRRTDAYFQIMMQFDLKTARSVDLSWLRM